MGNSGRRPTSFDDHSGTAGKILKSLEAFADEVADRGVPAHLTHVIRDGKYLKGSRLGQRPERFAEEYLVWPMLNALGYEFWSQPYGYPKWDSSRPDFAVQNLDCGIECAVIGEVKTPNKFEYADEQIREYLKRDLETATIGFATDGIQWKVYARPERKETIVDLGTADFSRAFRMMPSRHLEQESYSAHSARKSLADAEKIARPTIETEARGGLTE